MASFSSENNGGADGSNRPVVPVATVLEGDPEPWTEVKLLEACVAEGLDTIDLVAAEGRTPVVFVEACAAVVTDAVPTAPEAADWALAGLVVAGTVVATAFVPETAEEDDVTVFGLDAGAVLT